MDEQTPQKKNRFIPFLGIIFLLLGIAYYYSNKLKEQNYLNPISSVFESNNTNEVKEEPSTAVVNVFFSEVYPVQLLFLKNTHEGVFEGSIHNSGERKKEYEISYKLSEFGDEEFDVIQVEPGEDKTFRCTPYSNSLLSIESPVMTHLQIKIKEKGGDAIFEESYDIKINPSDEIPWRIDDTDCSYLIASWVTPKNSAVERLVGKSREEYGHTVNMAYAMTDEEFDDFAKAVFNTVRDEGVSYLSSTISFGSGHTQRVRLPEKSIQYKTANCIDGAVLLASMFENVGLKPYIIIIPGHAFVAVARPGKENKKIYLETTLLGRSKLESIMTFETTYSAAKKRGFEEYKEALKKYGANNQLQVVDIRQCRKDHVLPM